MSYFCFFNNMRPYLILAFSTIQYLRHTLLQYFKQIKASTVPYFRNFNRIILQQYLIPPFSLEENPSRTLFLHFKQYKTPAVPQLCLILAFSIIQTTAVSYFSICNRIEPQQHLVSKFLMKGNPTAPHFCFLKNMKPQPHLSRTFFLAFSAI